MKQIKSELSIRMLGIAAVALVIVVLMTGLPLTGCRSPIGGGTNQTPVAADYTIGNLTQTAGSVTAVTITPKSGKSGGKITIYYEGASGTTYDRSTILPTAAGTYIVTFDVAVATGFNAANKLSAGTLVINAASGTNQTPTAADYEIGNLTQTTADVTAVTITPKTGKSTGAVTIYYEGTGGTTYAKSALVPTAAGTYAVTFDVAAASGWYAASGLIAGTLMVNQFIEGNQTPTAADYTIGSLTQTAGSVTAVTITPKTGKSTGAVTVYYEGTGGTTYAKSVLVPTAAGTYAVTFDVAAASGWYAASGLIAGSLIVNAKNASTLTVDAIPAQTYTGNAITPTVTVKDGTTTLTLNTDYTVTYTNNTNAGTATVTITGKGNYTGSSGSATFAINNITYTVTQTGGAAGSATTTGLTFTFNASIDSLGISVSDITIGGVAAKAATSTFTGSGARRTLSSLTVNSAGNATVSINKTGVESGSKTVQVYFVTGTATISVTFIQISDAASDIPIVIPDLRRVSGTSSAALTLDNSEQYDADSITWRVNGVEIGAGASVTLNARNPVYSAFGTYYLMISVKKGGVSYNKTVPFTVQY